MARALHPPVSGQTIRNWADKEQCPVAFRDDKGVRWFDLAQVERWRRENKVTMDGTLRGVISIGRGGWRPGAGRPPPANPPHPFGRKNSIDREGLLPVLVGEGDEDAGGGGGGEPVRFTLSGAIAKDCPDLALPVPDRRALEEVARDPTRRLLHPLVAKGLQLQANASLQDAKRRQLTGELINRDEAAAAWAETLGILVRGIENLPRRAGPAILAVFARICEQYARAESEEERSELLERARVHLDDELTRAGTELRRDLTSQIVKTSKAG